MLDTFITQYQSTSVEAHEKRSKITWWLMYLGLLGFSAFVALLLFLFGARPGLLAWCIFILCVSIILYRPRYGLYLTIFLTLVGDSSLWLRYPFTLSFSSSQSYLYLGNAVIISPLELFIVLIAVSWIGRMAFTRKFVFYAGPLFWYAVIFLGFVVFGFAYGVGTGGNLSIALWESRAITYLPVLMILASNLLEERKHYSWLVWAAMLAIFIESLFGLYVVAFILNFDFSTVDRLSEHSAAIHMNTYFVLLGAVYLFRDSSRTKRIVLPIFIVPILASYLVAQRRAAFLTLGVALVLMTYFLFRDHRKTFNLVMPVFVVVALGYLAVFWNVQNALGLPAQAVKSVVAPDSASHADQLSNIYRDIENFNINFTIHAKPLTGIGFGQKFYIVWPMPDISGFIWWEYITHNSIGWMWMKTGVGGFTSMLAFVAMAVITGTRATFRMPHNDLGAISLYATLYVVMHFIYAYADMSWDIQSMVYLGILLGIINSIERVTEIPVEVAAKRWPWQPEPEPAPTLLPLPNEQ